MKAQYLCVNRGKMQLFMKKINTGRLGSWILIVTIIAACGSAGEESQTTAQANGKDKSELDILTQAIEQAEDKTQAYKARAMHYYQLQAYDLAANDLLKALESDSTNPELLHMLADSYMDNYQSRKALKTMEKAAELNPKRIPTLLKLSEYQLILKQHEDALRTIDKIMKIDPQSAEAFFMTGMVFRELRDTSRSINAFQRVTELDPGNVDAWIILGNLFDEMNNPIALQYFDNAVRVAPDNPNTLHSKAYYLQNNGKIKEAIAIYKELNSQFKNYVDGYLNTGILYITLDSLDRAMEHFNIAVSTSPTDPRTYYFRGLVHEMSEQMAEAKSDYEQALRLQPDYQEAKEALEMLK